MGEGVGATAASRRRRSVWAACLLVASLAGPAALAIPAPAAVPAAVALASASAGSPCGIALPTGEIVGNVTVAGGPAGLAAGLLLNYSYGLAVQVSWAANGTVAETECFNGTGSVTTGPTGAFAFTPTAPVDRCGELNLLDLCWAYSAPLGPLALGPAGGPPAGYTVALSGPDSDLGLALVLEFAGVRIAPTGPTLMTSVGAPTALTATALAGNGSASPLAANFTWSVNGTGWTAPSTDAASLTLTALPGAGIAAVGVRASASAPGASFPAAEATVDVVAVPTTVDAGGTNRTTVDAGGSVAVELTAVGAPEFAYTAAVEPGLGLAPVRFPCTTTLATGGLAAISCSTDLTYPVAGLATPSANVSNGYSADSWALPEIRVDPPPALEVLGPSVGYAGAPFDVELTAVNGSGAPPFREACLAVGGSPLSCTASAGPDWSFAPTFDAAGNFSADAWAIDADGTNRSVAFVLRVVPPLAVGPVTAPVGGLSAGATGTLRATVSGGDLPLRYWWNVSGENAPLLAGTLASDGPVAVTLAPATPGPLVLDLSVVDALGTVLSREAVLEVGPAGPAQLALADAGPAVPVVAGVAVPLGWEVLGPSASADTGFASAVELVLTGPTGPPLAWVNASGIGPLPDLGGGAYAVPGSAWVDGYLNVTVAVGTATTVTVALAGASLPAGGPSTAFAVQADRLHLRLSSPEVVRAGVRSNATLWRVTDPYGNPVPGAPVTIAVSFSGGGADLAVAAIALADNASGVWVNYSVPASGGAVEVEDGAQEVLLGPLIVPATPAAPVAGPTVEAVATAVPVGAAGMAVLAVVRRRRRGRSSTTGEEELRRWAEGRERAIELIGRTGPADLAGLEAAWGTRPVPAELADWIASLVADGTVGATVGPDGRARFCLAGTRPSRPRVVVDPELLDAGLRRRDEALGPRGPA